MANMWKRIAALCLDWLLIGFVYWSLAKLGATIGLWPSTASEFRANIIDQSIWFISWVFFSLVFYVRSKRWGQTLGKQVFKIRVEASDPFQFAAREALKIAPLCCFMLQPIAIVLFLLYFADLVYAYFNPGMSIHDLLLKTYVQNADSAQEESLQQTFEKTELLN